MQSLCIVFFTAACGLCLLILQVMNSSTIWGWNEKRLWPRRQPSPHRLFPCLWLLVLSKASSPHRSFPSISRREVCQFHLCNGRNLARKRQQPEYSPNPASGFSVLILSRQSWLKNMYADRARFGASGFFFELVPLLRVGAFSPFSAALRWFEGGRIELALQKTETWRIPWSLWILSASTERGSSWVVIDEQGKEKGSERMNLHVAAVDNEDGLWCDDRAYNRPRRWRR